MNSPTELPPATASPQARHLSAFVARHIGPNDREQRRMLAALGYTSLSDLMAAALPAGIREPAGELRLPPALTEPETRDELASIAALNRRMVQMIGLGYHNTHVPAVLQRTILENPAWYTAYTPYQPEISQGRLEALLNFQTMVADLTGLPVAGASLLDEPTAAAEAMAVARRNTKASDSAAFVVDADVLPQTLAVVRTRAEPLDIPVVVADLRDGLPAGEIFGVLVQYPGCSGRIDDHSEVVERAHERGALVTVAADLLALTLLRSPGELGADIAVGSAQRFGVPLGFGGPHAGYMAVSERLTRSLPGRLVGVSKAADGAVAYRLALQTREQHIRRERATSNICTAQVLLAVMAGMYAVWHGSEGLTEIATRTHRHAVALAARLRHAGVAVVHGEFFDTVLVRVPGQADAVVRRAAGYGVNLRFVDADHVGVSCDETTTPAHVAAVAEAFGAPEVEGNPQAELDGVVPAQLRRTSEFLTHPVFSAHRSETAMMRYTRRLADFDYALDRGMIPLGSCTMKLNAAVEMAPVTWPEFAEIHPFAPAEQTAGYRRLIGDLERWLVAITGYDAASVQPNAGSQGELAGLLAIRAYHRASGEPATRNVCLIPASAHGTNAASAVMAGMRVAVVACDDGGNVDLADLRAKLDKHAGEVAALMVTYPSTHGVYEETIGDMCALVHEAGGQVYVDGANLNALVGYARPGKFGADVSHLNLHKTFCVPHGGGGPGVGPVVARAHLAPYLPNHPLADDGALSASPGPVAGAPQGSAGVLPIPWAYLRLMGAEGLTEATGVAVLAANYVAARLKDHYPVLYTGRSGLVAHECIVDLRPITKSTGVTVEDVAKRLIDYGFHAPTMSFPVAGTLMIEPTESENLAELDRFIDAMIAIKAEIDQVAAGTWPVADSPLRNAPHTAAMLVGEWTRPYDRKTAVFPGSVGRGVAGAGTAKYWPPVGRIDNAYGDRNLMCACPPVEELASE